MLCAERGIDSQAVEKRYIFTLNPNDVEQMKAINVSIEKVNLEKQKKLFGKYELSSIMPLPIGITNLVKLDEKKNELIINLEEKTTLTFCERGQIDSVETIESSVLEALEQITMIENSKAKAYNLAQQYAEKGWVIFNIQPLEEGKKPFEQNGDYY